MMSKFDNSTKMSKTEHSSLMPPQKATVPPTDASLERPRSRANLVAKRRKRKRVKSPLKKAQDD
jgi:hypothetical protein